nr:hypothetical protein [uncultured Agathobaculum sp.]
MGRKWVSLLTVLALLSGCSVYTHLRRQFVDRKTAPYRMGHAGITTTANISDHDNIDDVAQLGLHEAP